MCHQRHQATCAATGQQAAGAAAATPPREVAGLDDQIRCSGLETVSIMVADDPIREMHVDFNMATGVISAQSSLLCQMDSYTAISPLK